MVFNNLFCHRAETGLWMRTTRWNLLLCKRGLGRISQFQGRLVSVQWKQDKGSMNMERTWVSLVKKEKSEICMGSFPFLSPPSSKIFLSCLMSLLWFKGQATRQDKKTKGKLASCTGEQSVMLAALSSWSASLQVQINRFLFLMLFPSAASVYCLILTNFSSFKCFGVQAEEDIF